MNDFILLLPVLLPVFAGVLLQCLPFAKEKSKRDRYVIIMFILTASLTGSIAFVGEKSLLLFYLTKEIPFYVQTDGLAKFFLLLINIVWPLVGIFSLEYMKHEEREEQFVSFYFIVYGILNGLGLSGNLITFYLFYECMTLLTVPFVLHTRTRQAVYAAKKYLFYSIAGASMALFGFFFLANYTTSLTFTKGGTLNQMTLAGNESVVLFAVFLLLLGFGTKAGMFPMHGWLPTAHPVAPAPASAVLSGVITKAGVLGILRVVFYIVGTEFLRGTWVQYAFLTLTLITVFMGSMLAYKEQNMKKRFAYSTVSQVSYILFGIAILTEEALLGSLLHIVFHSLIKNTLFLVAGAIIYKTGKTMIKELKGIGKQMPIVIWCFTFVSLALVGIPPTGGFVSKWFLAIGALEAEIPVFSILGPIVLLLSALLTAGYLLPITIHGFLTGAEDTTNWERKEPTIQMLLPIGLFMIGAVVLGMFPNVIIEPITQMITGLF